METAMENLSWMSWWADSDWVVRSVFILLVALSVISWAVIVYKAQQFARVFRAERASASSLDGGVSAAQASKAGMPTHYLFGVFGKANGGASRESAESRLGQAARECRLELESGLTALATIGNSAPFIGLFGTVWGIMHALQGLGGEQALSMDMVAGPVAEALVATAAGLFTAIPAVVGYNLLLRRLRFIAGVVEGNALRILDQVYQAKGG